MGDLIEKFLTLGMTKEQAKGAWTFAYRMAIVFGIGAGWGWFAAIGVPQFALAGEMDKRISSMESAVLSKLKATEAVQASTVKLLNKQLASTVAAQIRIQAQKRCKAKDSEDREAANREIDRLQEEYAQYREIRYGVPACSEL